MSNNALSESFDNGFGAISNSWNVPGPSNGEVHLTGASSMMEWATGRDAGHGYGTYTVTAKVDGNQPGPGIILWPGDNQWPGQEMDMVEITPDGSGRQYGTVHWNAGGHDNFTTVLYDGVQGGVFHDYQMIWAPGQITFKVDGQTKGTVTEMVPTDFDHGGMNDTIGLMNTNGSTGITVSNVSFTPLGQSAPAASVAAAAPAAVAVVAAPAAEVVTVAAAPASSGAIDWNAVAAAVTANFEATGRWEMPADLSHPAAPAPAPVAPAVSSGQTDWNALAAQATANWEATGHWFI